MCLFARIGHYNDKTERLGRAPLDCYDRYFTVRGAMYLPLLILCLLLIPYGLALGARRAGVIAISNNTACYLSLSLSFFVFSAAHWALNSQMALMVPPLATGLVDAKVLVHLTGGLELVIGGALLVPKTRRLTALVGLAVIAVFFTANIYAAFTRLEIGGYGNGPSWLFVRGPVQGFLAIWAYVFCYKAGGLGAD